MSKIILATGINDLEEMVRERLTEFPEPIQSVLFLQALTIVDVDANTIVLLSDILQNSGDQHIIDVIDHLRKAGARVIFLGVERPSHDPMIQALISRGVYDLFLSDEISIDDILNAIERPATYADVAHFLTMRTGVSNVPSFRRPVILNKEDENEISGAETSPLPSPSRKLFRNRSRDRLENGVKTQKTIIVTGLPGAGVSFVALQVALSYSDKQRVALIEASDRPTYVSWLSGPPNDDGSNQLAMKRTPERAWWYTDNLRVYPANESGPALKSVMPAAASLDVDVVVIDARLQDVNSHGSSTDILVVPPDPTKIRYANVVNTSEVVVNMAPKVLPVEIYEYGRNWPGASIRTIPWRDEQALSVVSGQTIHLQKRLGALSKE